MAATQDAVFAARAEMVEELLARAQRQGRVTDLLYTMDDDRQIYTPDRAIEQASIIHDLLEAAADVPAEGHAVMAGGLAGAGKTTTLATHAGIEPALWLTLDPDIIKREMAARQMIPTPDGLSPMEAASLVHDESSSITNAMALRALEHRVNVVWDVTMAGEKSARRRLSELRDAGFIHVRGIFVDVPLEVAQQRAWTRYQQDQKRWLVEGKGYGGRYIPAGLLRDLAGNGPVSLPRLTFDALRSSFNKWEVWDNGRDGCDPERKEWGGMDP